MTKIKICGITQPSEIAYINETQPDYCGFVINVADRRRSVTPEQVRLMTRNLSEKVLAVGVFVDAPVKLIVDLLSEKVIQMVQLHGQEDEAYIKQLKRLTDQPLIKAFNISSAQDVEQATNSSAEYILLDNGNGGTGQTFDWSLLDKVKRPFILAGGLSPTNIPEAIASLHPYGLDISSGVEKNGVKDKEKMVAAVRRTRNV